MSYVDGWKLTTPVAMLIFNRPDTTARVFAEVAKAKPPRLLVVADGPRPDRPGEDAKCSATRAVVERIDWDCEVTTHYADANMGCRQRVSSGLDWVFSTVEQAIILEDDCVPAISFFRFCDELLTQYRDDERVMMISGDNFQHGQRRTEYSYYFSRYCHVWGWATWRRAWHHYDVDMKSWPLIRDGKWLEDIISDKQAAARWSRTFQAMYERRVDTWDSQWMYACWTQGGLSINPNVNLISNIGFHPDATHTTKSENKFANMDRQELGFPLQHPPFTIRDASADEHVEKTMFNVDVLTWLRLGFAKAARMSRQLAVLR
jgi:hypothetical protein